MRGDLLEVGVYMGKSAIFLGHHLTGRRAVHGLRPLRGGRPGQRQPGRVDEVVRVAHPADLRARTTSPSTTSCRRSSRARAPLVPSEVSPATCRFVHIDASHLYEHVHGDIGAARDIAAARRHRRPGRLPLRAHARRLRGRVGGRAQPRPAPDLPEHPEAVRDLGRSRARPGGAARHDPGAGRTATSAFRRRPDTASSAPSPRACRPPPFPPSRHFTVEPRTRRRREVRVAGARAAEPGARARQQSRQASQGRRSARPGPRAQSAASPSTCCRRSSRGVRAGPRRQAVAPTRRSRSARRRRLRRRCPHRTP